MHRGAIEPKNGATTKQQGPEPKKFPNLDKYIAQYIHRET
jgi:hypothetical protein